jgi:hypothetical protein
VGEEGLIMGDRGTVPQPRVVGERDLGGRSRPLTFFVSAEERSAVLKRLGRLDRDRRRALLKALGVSVGSGARGTG